jgi:hypothetical protein
MLWLSKFFCYLGSHHWLKSKSLKKDLVCVICRKATKHLKEYEKLRG